TCDMGDTSRLMVLLDECRNLGIVVHPPDINSGQVEFGLFNGEVTYGLAAIKKVGAQAVRSIVEERENGPFADLYDLCDRVDLRVINKRVIENFIQGGAMDGLPGTRAQKMATLDKILAQAQKRQNERKRGQTFLDLLGGSSQNETVQLENVPPWDESETLHREHEALGFYFSGHPLDRFRGVLGRIVNTDSLTLAKRKERATVVLAGLVSDSRAVLDRKGNQMAFVAIEDFHGSYEVIAFSDCYQKSWRKLQQDQIVLIKGKVSVKDRSDKKVIVDEVYTIDEVLCELPRKIHLTLMPDRFGERELEDLMSIVRRYPGEKEIIFHWRENGKDRYVVRSRKAGIAPGPELFGELEKVPGVEHVEISL
ncbi:MAG: hypothetical protein KAI64_02695, partial [Thermoplasmata archaeon]|nr:hypothetical protein [Thermoplasmata archaeon]